MSGGPIRNVLDYMRTKVEIDPKSLCDIKHDDLAAGVDVRYDKSWVRAIYIQIVIKTLQQYHT